MAMVVMPRPSTRPQDLRFGQPPCERRPATPQFDHLALKNAKARSLSVADSKARMSGPYFQANRSARLVAPPPQARRRGACGGGGGGGGGFFSWPVPATSPRPPETMA